MEYITVRNALMSDSPEEIAGEVWFSLMYDDKHILRDKLLSLFHGAAMDVPSY